MRLVSLLASYASFRTSALRSANLIGAFMAPILQTEAAAPVDGDDLAGDVRRLGNEIEHRPCDVVRVAGALEQRVRDDPLACQVVERAVLGPHDRARRNAVHTNLGAEIAGQRA